LLLFMWKFMKSQIKNYITQYNTIYFTIQLLHFETTVVYNVIQYCTTTVYCSGTMLYKQIIYVTCLFVELLLGEEQVEAPVRVAHEVVVLGAAPEGLSQLAAPLHGLADGGELLAALLLALQGLLDGGDHLAELDIKQKYLQKLRSNQEQNIEHFCTKLMLEEKPDYKSPCIPTCTVLYISFSHDKFFDMMNNLLISISTMGV